MKRMMNRSPRAFLLGMLMCAFAMVGFVSGAAWAETSTDGGAADQSGLPAPDTGSTADTGGTADKGTTTDTTTDSGEKMGCSQMEGEPANMFMLMMVLLALGVAGVRKIVVDPLGPDKRR